MHEASLATTVLTVLRDRPGPHERVRVHVADISSPPEVLAAQVRTYLDAADPPVAVGTVEVVPLARDRLCARCATAWSSTDPRPPCPACGGDPLPVPHDHRIEVELLPGGPP